MTVIRLSTGGLVLHSPVSLRDALAEEINIIGEVKYLVAPNRFHHLHIGDWAALYPEAEVWGVPGLAEKRRDVKFDRVLDDDSAIGPEAEVGHFLFLGAPALNEVVFHHPESKTLILTDLLFNYSGDLPLGLKLVTKTAGVYGAPNVSRLIRYFIVKDREKAREPARRVISLNFERIILSHGDIIETSGREALRKAFQVF